MALMNKQQAYHHLGMLEGIAAREPDRTVTRQIGPMRAKLRVVADGTTPRYELGANKMDKHHVLLALQTYCEASDR